MKIRTHHMAALLLLGAALPAAAQTEGTAGHSEATRPPSAPNLITDAEIRTSSAASTYDLIRRLRPRWLAGFRGPTTFGGGRVTELAVYEGGQHVGGPAFLRTLAPEAVLSLRYYSPTDAPAYFGPEHTSGVIVLTRRN
jgi:hypothetical protein